MFSATSVGATLLCFAPAAHAGHWEVDRYIVESGSKFRTEEYKPGALQEMAMAYSEYELDPPSGEFEYDYSEHRVGPKEQSFYGYNPSNGEYEPANIDPGQATLQGSLEGKVTWNKIVN